MVILKNMFWKKTYKKRSTQRQIDCHSTGFKIGVIENHIRVSEPVSAICYITRTRSLCRDYDTDPVLRISSAFSIWIKNRSSGTRAGPGALNTLCLAQRELSPLQYFFLVIGHVRHAVHLVLKEIHLERSSQSAISYSFVQ